MLLVSCFEKDWGEILGHVCTAVTVFYLYYTYIVAHIFETFFLQYCTKEATVQHTPSFTQFLCVIIISCICVVFLQFILIFTSYGILQFKWDCWYCIGSLFYIHLVSVVLWMLDVPLCHSYPCIFIYLLSFKYCT